MQNCKTAHNGLLTGLERRDSPQYRPPCSAPRYRLGPGAVVPVTGLGGSVGAGLGGRESHGAPPPAQETASTRSALFLAHGAPGPGDTVSTNPDLPEVRRQAAAPWVDTAVYRLPAGLPAACCQLCEVGSAAHLRAFVDVDAASFGAWPRSATSRSCWAAGPPRWCPWVPWARRAPARGVADAAGCLRPS